jgi:uncharacterized protein YcfJ
MRKIVTIAVVASTLALGACQTSNMTGLLGAGAGAAGGGYAGSMIGKGMGNTIATAGGAIAGGLLGGLFGKSIGMPWDNANQIDQNSAGVYQNSAGVYQNGQRIGQMEKRVDRNGNVVYVQTQGSQQNVASQQQNPYTCRVQSNYVVCNSN